VNFMHRRATLGAEWYCAQGAMSSRILDVIERHKSEKVYRNHIRDISTPLPTGGDQAEAGALATVDFLVQKIAPLALDVRSTEPVRVNLVLPSIDFKYLFGGYIGKLNMGLKLSRKGYHVRLVIVDECDFDPSAWRDQIQGYQELAPLFDEVEVAYRFYRSEPLIVSPRDTFIATTWWTAHVAHQAARDIGKEKFTYLIQEYEPMTFPMGSYWALAQETYSFPHFAVFSTRLLRDYFKRHRIGVFAVGEEAGLRDSIYFENAIYSATPASEDLRSRERKKLLYYARPEAHASRNMFEIGIMALNSAIERGVFDSELWEFYGIGTVSDSSRLNLVGKRTMALLPRLDLSDYIRVLPTFDVGLSLMLTPHPSLVPIEMAAAGMLTVTNTFENKTTDELEQISANLIAVPPTVPGVVSGLAAAASAVNDIDRRVAGAHVRWATRWDDALGSEVIDRLCAFLAVEQVQMVR
jgi:beta-1,2-rhamnosyltransferase WsaF-like protein